MPNIENYKTEIEKLRAENLLLKQKFSNKFQKDYLYKVFDEFHFPVYITDIETKIITFANKNAVQTFGNIVDKKCWEAFYEKEICEECEYQKNIKNSKDKFTESKRESFFSKYKTWYLLYESEFDIDGIHKEKVNIALNINENKRIQEENTERTQNLRLIFNNVNDPIFVIRDNKFRFVNKATEKFFGKTAEEILKDNIEDYMHKPFKNKILNVCDQILRENNNKKEYFIKLKNAENEIIDVKAKIELLYWKGSKSILVVLKDVTEEREVTKQLKENRRFYKILFEHSPLPVLLFQDNKIAMFNNAFKKYLKGNDYTVFQNIQLSSFMPSETQKEIDKAVESLNKGQEYVSVENIKLFNLKKEIVNVSLIISKIFYKSKTAIIVIFNDITAIIKAEEELRKIIAVKDKFFSIIAHDLRNPFNQIIGFSDLLKDEIYHDDLLKRKRLVEYIYLAAENGQKLLENLLSWAKTQTGSIIFQPENIYLKEVLNGVVDFYKINAKNKEIVINTEGVDESVCIFFDLEMLKTVLRNLISNALKYTERGGKIEIITFDKIDLVQINVSDTGVGMIEEQKNKIFKLDESFTMTGTENEKGSGLGLMVCKEFIEKNSGKIFVESEKGKGTTISFTAKKCID